MYDAEVYVDEFSPLDNERIKDAKVKIEAHIKSHKIKIKKTHIKLLLDNEEVLFKLDKGKIKYKTKKKLQSGRHTVLLLIGKNENIKYEWKFFVEEKEKFQHYKGNLHSHTKYSSGQGTPTEAFKSAKNNKLDFFAVTDHNKAFKSVNKWQEYKLKSEEFNKKNKNNIALSGIELSVKGIGHLNLLNYSEFFDSKEITLSKLVKEIENKPNVILCINHPGKNINNLKNKLDLNKNIRLIEVGNGNKDIRYNRYEKEYYKLLDYG
ncbi:PHP domain-containing protein [Haloimpatiens sp. FM7315]|uniref:PHP domain-containing protein n=1 Tax=Haloimpatiens sp. FM7315 TaxID=3298609 RepID=UPI00370B46C7